MSVTMKELAYMAGVSRATVDRALNGRGGVNPETKSRVIELANKMGYRPNIVAQVLSSPNKAFKIGCILRYINNDLHSLVRNGVEDAARELSIFGVQMVLKSMHSLETEEQLRYLDEIEKEKVQVIIITPINAPEIVMKLQELITKGIEIVCITADINNVNYLAYVGCDHLRSGRIAANLMSMLTPSKAEVAVFLASEKMLGHEQRLRGFKEAIDEKYSKLKIVSVCDMQDDEVIGYIKTRDVLLRHSNVKLMFYVGAGARGGIKAIEESPRKDDIKVVAYDLYNESRKYLLSGEIVSAAIYQEPYKQGYTAVKTASEYLLYGKFPEKKRIYMNTELAVAESFDE